MQEGPAYDQELLGGSLKIESVCFYEPHNPHIPPIYLGSAHTALIN